MSDSEEEYYGYGYSSEEDYGGGGYSSEENYGGGSVGYSSEENNGGGGYSSEENHGGVGYSSEDNHGGGGYSSEENYSGGGGYSYEEETDLDLDLDEEEEDYVGQSETDQDEEDSCGYESDNGVPPLEVVKSNIGSYGSENVSNFQYNDYEDGKNYSGKFTNGYKTQEFVEKRTGNPGLKEEVKYKSYYKVDDKIGGLKTEYETQVKTTKKVTTTKTDNISKYSSSSYAAPTKPSSYKRLNYK